MKQARAREEHVVAVETEQRQNKCTIGRTEAAEAECGGIVCCSPQHVSASLLSELSNTLCAWSAVVSPLCFFNEYSGSGLSEGRYHPPSKPASRLLHGRPESEKCLLCEIEVKPVRRSMSCGYSLSVLCGFDCCAYSLSVLRHFD